MSARKVLHPLTEASIRLQGVGDGRAGGSGWLCGCEHRSARLLTGWWLCPYHLGFDAGVEAGADDLAEKLDALHRPVDETGGIWCDHDSQAWPCPTHRIVHGEAQR